MKIRCRRAAGLLSAGLLALTCLTGAGAMVGLTGCSVVPAEQLYCLPEAPQDHNALRNALADAVADGYAFLAPTGGAHREPAERIDLNGDGRDEAVAFLTGPDRSVVACVYARDGGNDDFHEIARLDCAGTGLSAVDYLDVNGDGMRELLLSCSVGDAAPQVLQVWTVSEAGGTLLSETLCSRWEAASLDSEAGTGVKDLICFNDGQNGAEAVRCTFSGTADGEPSVHSAPIALSGTLAGLASVQSGTLADGTPTLITSFAEGTAIRTDILVAEGEGLRTVSAQEQLLCVPALGGTLFYPGDYNHDGYTEFPMLCSLPSISDKQSAECAVLWEHLSSTGEQLPCEAEYYSDPDGWRLSIPESWVTEVGVHRSSTLSDGCIISMTEFTRTDGQRQLTVYRIDGDNCLQYAQKAEISVLYSGAGWAIAVKQEEQSEVWEGSLSLAQLSDGLRLTAEAG